ncbi:uncharacterized protein LOC131875874 [Cryptomeria japonica]|uniref:uncharacterized protein LOC131875874 n=1 Tax=Cryptomeria japonica TaxID=3369 RepID=UPI0027DA0956|nr:uncharacterized protein LOC131875874 [Cryptomeria japonica]
MVDSFIQSRWSLIQLRPVHGFSRVRPSCGEHRQEEELWSKPEQGWIKINFDGASRGNPGIFGVGCVAHNKNEVILFKGAKRLQDETNNDAEVQATLLAIELVVNMKALKVHLEGDYKISHIVRGGNALVDALSNMACELDKGVMRWWDKDDATTQWHV